MKPQALKTLFAGMLFCVALPSITHAYTQQTATEVFSVDDRFSRLEPVRPIPGDRILLPCRGYADLTVSSLPGPQWDHANHRSIIQAVIKNQGGRAAGSFVVRLTVDGSTIREAVVGGLAAASATTVTFTVPFWVYNPDAQYDVKVDYSNRVQECNEKNNVKEFFGLG